MTGHLFRPGFAMWKPGQKQLTPTAARPAGHQTRLLPFYPHEFEERGRISVSRPDRRTNSRPGASPHGEIGPTHQGWLFKAAGDFHASDYLMQQALDSGLDYWRMKQF